MSQAPGFVTGCWVELDGAKGASVLVFETEESAREAAQRAEPMIADSPVQLQSIEVGKVVAQAGQLAAI